MTYKYRNMFFKATLTAILCLIASTISLVSPKAATETESDGNTEFFSHCQAGILYEATTDTVLCEKNADTAYIPASMTKVMTAIITCEHNPNLEGELTVTDKAVSRYYCSWVDSPHLMAGETISYYQCVEYMLLPSANEAASALSFAISDGDRAAFVEEMNQKAAELGCEDTYFLDPTGLSPANHVSCRDMVKIAQYAMQFDVLREILTHYEGMIPANDLRMQDIHYTSLLRPKYPDDRYENPYASYITGVKTGWIDQSGYNYACSMEKDGLVYYAVAMGGTEEDYGDGSGRIIQGDFRDIIEVLSLTDGLTASDLKKMHPSTTEPWIASGMGLLLMVILGVFSGKCSGKR